MAHVLAKTRGKLQVDEVAATIEDSFRDPVGARCHVLWRLSECDIWWGLLDLGCVTALTGSRGCRVEMCCEISLHQL
jgi:hypothetical protein